MTAWQGTVLVVGGGLIAIATYAIRRYMPRPQRTSSDIAVLVVAVVSWGTGVFGVAASVLT